MHIVANIFLVSSVLAASAQEVVDDAFNDIGDENINEYQQEDHNDSFQSDVYSPMEYGSYYDYNYLQYPQEFYQQYVRAPDFSGVEYNYLSSLNGEMPPYDPRYLSTDGGYYVPVYMDEGQDASQDYEWVDENAYNAVVAKQLEQTSQISNPERSIENLEDETTS